jgi:hypothetical protein
VVNRAVRFDRSSQMWGGLSGANPSSRSSLHQAAPGLIFAGTPHAQGRIHHLGLERKVTKLGQDRKGGEGAGVVTVPVAAVDLLIGVAFPLHDPYLYHARGGFVKKNVRLVRSTPSRYTVRR